MQRKQEHLYKILVIGELATGKTSLVKRYVHGIFSQHYRATIGVDFALKVLNWDVDTIIRLQLWDIAGQERFGHMTRVYYKEAQGAIIVYDQTRAATFDAVMKWKNDLDAKVELADQTPLPCVLVGNKCDVPRDASLPSREKLEIFARENGFTAWYETSAKDNIGVDEAMRSLIAKILQNEERLKGQMDNSIEQIDSLDAEDRSSRAGRRSGAFQLSGARQESDLTRQPAQSVTGQATENDTTNPIDTRQRVLHVDADIVHVDQNDEILQDELSPFIAPRKTEPATSSCSTTSTSSTVPPTTPTTTTSTTTAATTATTTTTTTPSTTTATEAAAIILLPPQKLYVEDRIPNDADSSIWTENEPRQNNSVIEVHNEQQEIIYSENSMKPIRNFTIRDGEPILHTYNTGVNLPWSYRVASNAGDIHCHFCNSARDKRCGEDFDEVAYIKNCREALCTADGYLRFTVPFRKPYDENEVSVENDRVGIFPRNDVGTANEPAFRGIRCPEVFTKCRKLEQQVEGRTIIVRTCGWLGDAREPSKPRLRTSSQVRSFDSECYEDACNAAANLTLASSMAFILVLAAVFLSATFAVPSFINL